MNVVALRTALRQRQAAVERARADLLRAVADETDAAAAVSVAQAQIESEAAAAAALDADDAAVDAFGAWLPRGRLLAARARDILHAAGATVTVARAVLAAARVAEASVERAIAEHAERERTRQARIEQTALDESGGRPRDGA